MKHYFTAGGKQVAIAVAARTLIFQRQLIDAEYDVLLDTFVMANQQFPTEIDFWEIEFNGQLLLAKNYVTGTRHQGQKLPFFRLSGLGTLKVFCTMIGTPVTIGAQLKGRYVLRT